jgi:hypothetical protein
MQSKLLLVGGFDLSSSVPEPSMGDVVAGLRWPGLRVPAIALQDDLNGARMSKFKIGQAPIYRKGSVKLGGRYIVLAVLPQPTDKSRHRIRSQEMDASSMLPKNENPASPNEGRDLD